MTADQVVEVFRRCGALLHGHFVLRSGLHSRTYFQCALVLQDPVATSELCGAMVEKLKIEKWVFHSVISPAMGGILVGHEVARHLGRRHIFAEKADGQLRIRRFAVKPGEKFLVAEDVITTGGAVREVMDRVREAGGEVVGVACLVNRSESKPELGAPLCSLLSLPVETFSPASIPDDLRSIPAVKPGSR
ncbi:MAG: orotate phosphoribosyltransferase [Verrucomicrobia bacterium]|nr:orotate phosphoribosyltransferase [Pseudomonadota bacterium]NBS05926.1 orotate phosphoribosyltransferase [Verrucomicrobiota bacterium]NBS78338.1 orotate phosphoribosyltransferase [bacterium]NBS49262.1 orotate phosphoribosyltransferase [Verrucomicrobiota bacterium]NBT23088.1 orotate phosphoribosyltransferase [bacterium]